MISSLIVNFRILEISSRAQMRLIEDKADRSMMFNRS